MDFDQLQHFFDDKPKISLPVKLENVFGAYQTSLQCELLDSETGRQLYGESVKLADDSDKQFVIEPLRYLTLKELARTYRGGTIDERIQLDDLQLFGELCDVELPLFDLVDLEVNIVYWLEC